MSVRPFRVLLFGLLLAVALAIGLWYLGVWAVGRTFQESRFDGLANLLEASVGGSVANGNVQLQPAQNRSEQGMLDFYRNHQGKLKEDKAYLRTWLAALTIGDAALKYHTAIQWRDSEALDAVPPSERHDAWGHSFCVTANEGVTAVVSPGPDALTSLQCGELNISKSELDSFTHGRLNRHPSGALILVLGN